MNDFRNVKLKIDFSNKRNSIVNVRKVFEKVICNWFQRPEIKKRNVSDLKEIEIFVESFEFTFTLKM